MSFFLDGKIMNQNDIKIHQKELTKYKERFFFLSEEDDDMAKHGFNCFFRRGFVSFVRNLQRLRSSFFLFYHLIHTKNIR